MPDSLQDLNLNLLPHSIARSEGAQYALVHAETGKKLAVLVQPSSPIRSEFEGQPAEAGGMDLLIAPLSPHNAAALRAHLPWLNPSLMGLSPSAGMGDRIGFATPGHVRALRAVGGGLAPVFAQ
jgi:tagaturonate epimerase